MIFSPAASGRVRTLLFTLALAVAGTSALGDIVLKVTGGGPEVTSAVEGASLLAQARGDGAADPQDIYAAARADYARILGALYAEGHYSGVISIRIDGREAADIPPLDAPARIGRVIVTVEPGPQFRFGEARMRPYASGTALPPAYRDTLPARSTAISEAAEAGVEGWRQLGHAKARVSEQDIVAHHRTATLDSLLLLEPGPKVRFGELSVSGYERMRLQRIIKMAGFPHGEVFDPDKATRVSDRLRRSGVFRSVVLAEAETVNPDGTLDFSLTLEEEALRRFGVGAEVRSDDGLALTGYWLHRNLLGGGERLRFDAAITGLGSSSGTDYKLGIRIDRPATPHPDTVAFAAMDISRERTRDYVSDDASLTLGFNRYFNEQLSGSIGVAFETSRVTDATGDSEFTRLALPATLVWDRRDSTANPTRGSYLSAEAKPFVGFGTTGNGIRLFGDARAYRSFGAEDRLVFAGRLQVGTVIGPALLATPRDYLFFSGGGGTVRGQPYESLGIDVFRNGSLDIGGQSFLGLSGEARVAVTDRIGVVGFYDAGYITPTDLFGTTGEWHSGAGIGLRYFTAVGPIRLDVAAPVSGNTGDGLQLYLGIGQAF